MSHLRFRPGADLLFHFMREGKKWTSTLSNRSESRRLPTRNSYINSELKIGPLLKTGGVGGSEVQNAPSGSDHIALATFVAMLSMMESGLLRLLAVPRSLKNDTTEPSEVFRMRTATPARSLRNVNGATR